MSKFFKALEQAERERSLRRQAAERVEEPRAGLETAEPLAPEAPPPSPERLEGEEVHREVAAADLRRTTTAPTAVEDPVLREDDRTEPRTDRRGTEPGPVTTAPPPGRTTAPAAPSAGGSPDFDVASLGVEEHLASLLSPTGFAAEQYRALRHVLEQRHRTGALSMLAVSSPEEGDGKTTTAINLAGALAQAADIRVLLVDADLRRPSVSRYLGLGRPWRGLIDAILTPGMTLDEVAVTRPPFNLAVVPAGERPSAPYEALKSPRLAQILEEARRRYDFVILDTPPLVHVPDCRLLEQWVDAFVVVVTANKTSRRALEEALKLVDPDKLLGLVFNQDDEVWRRYHAYHSADVDDRSRNGSRWGRRWKGEGETR